VLACFRVAETFGKTKIDYVNVMLLFPNANQEVVWLDVTVEEMSGVHELNSLQLKV
jgi:hypothetical protein